VHGRSRACGYIGPVDYNSIAAVKAAVKVPVVANGDIDSPEKAKWVLEFTKADAVMIGRAAQGNPWIFKQIDEFIERGIVVLPPSLDAIERELIAHLQEHYQFYGEFIGLRTARKHVGWYLKQHLANLTNGKLWADEFNSIETIDDQVTFLGNIFYALKNHAQSSQNQSQFFENTGVVKQCWRWVA
jgi:tRNA-dihydrouridine synthase B